MYRIGVSLIPFSGVSTVLFLLSILRDHILHDTLLASSIRMHDTHASSNACHEIAGYPSICMVPHNDAPSTGLCPPHIDVYIVFSCRQVCGCHACTSMHPNSVLVICASNHFLTHVTIGGGQKSVDGFPLMQPNPGPLQI